MTESDVVWIGGAEPAVARSGKHSGIGLRANRHEVAPARRGARAARSLLERHTRCGEEAYGVIGLHRVTAIGQGNPDISIGVGGERRVSVGVIAIEEDDAIREPV